MHLTAKRWNTIWDNPGNKRNPPPLTVLMPAESAQTVKTQAQAGGDGACNLPCEANPATHFGGSGLIRVQPRIGRENRTNRLMRRGARPRREDRLTVTTGRVSPGRVPGSGRIGNRARRMPPFADSELLVPRHCRARNSSPSGRAQSDVAADTRRLPLRRGA